MNVRAKIILSLLLFAIPSLAFANVGTPLMWAGFAHLAVGNALIGIGEGLLLAFCFHLPRGRTIGVMILANYFSAWLGYWTLKWLASAEVARLLGDQPLYNAPMLLWLIGAISFTLTLVLELPFCLAALWRSKNRWIRAVLATLMAQTASYSLLVPYYLKASPITIYTEFQLNPTLAFARNRNAWIYFIGIDDGRVYRLRTDGSERQFFMEARFTNQFDRLYVGESQKFGHLDLWLATPAKNTDTRNTENIMIKERIIETRHNPDTNFIAGIEVPDSRFSFGLATEYRTETTNGWSLRVGYWAFEGIRATKTSTGERLRIAFEVLFVMDWYARNATVLPGDQIVYQLADQIVLLDLNTRQIGLITMGRGPVVVLETELPAQGTRSKSAR